MVSRELEELRARISRTKTLNRASNLAYHALGVVHTGVAGLVSVTGISKVFGPQVLGVLAASVGIIGAAVTWSKKLNDGRRDSIKSLEAMVDAELEIQVALADQSRHSFDGTVELIKRVT
jgi:hypothetical protein